MTISIKPTASGSTIEQDGSTVLSIESDRSVDVDSGTLHVDATNNRVGIGTSSPSQTLHVLNGTSSGGLIQYDGQSNSEFGLRIQSNISGGNFESDFANGTTALLDLFANSSTTSGGDLLVARTQSATPILLVKGNGTVGIGTSSPDNLLHIEGDQPTYKLTSTNPLSTSSGTETIADIDFEAQKNNLYRTTARIRARQDGTWSTGTANFAPTALDFFTQDISTSDAMTSPRMTITSGGNLLIDTTADRGRITVHKDTNTSATPTVYFSNDGGSGVFASFGNTSGTVIGTITRSGSSTAYNTSSDYRLKENVAPMSGSIDRLKQLKPSTWAWVQDGFHGEGFLAHEAQTVIPEAVTGTKDAMRTEEYEVTPAVEATYDEEDNELTPAVEAVMGTREVPDYQGIDQAKLVPLLTSALQEAITKIEDLETRIQALENA